MAAVVVDIELTNRCNAKCHFCPRDQTPHQGLMNDEVFKQALARAIEMREVVAELGSQTKVSLCGLGEPLLHPRAADRVRDVTTEGFECHMASNASLLDERRGRDLIDAGLSQININVGDEGDDYDDIYKLPFERTRDNILRFAEMAADKVLINIVLVDHRVDAAHIAKMTDYWKDLGFENFTTYDIINRGGALFVDHMRFETYPELQEARALLAESGTSFCVVPFIFMFIGYDGNYYLCCSDWKKEVPLGNVFDYSLVDVWQRKLERVASREPICHTCNCDPLNRLTEELRAASAGESVEGRRDALVAEFVTSSQSILDSRPRIEAAAAKHALPIRRHIPVTSV